MIIFRRINLRFWYFLIFISFLLILIRQNKSPRLITCENLCPYSSKLINNSIQFDSLHIIRHYPNFICPQNFRNLADWIFRWPDQFKEHIEQTTDDGRLIAPCLPPGSIIYVRIWSIDEFFNFIYPHLINDFVLITGEGDLSSPNDLQYLERSDSKIIHWFGQNGQYDVSKSKKFTHIPIGINCYEMADGIQNISSQKLNLTHQNLVLINFDKNTDKTGLRSNIWNDICISKNYSFITCIDKEKGVQIENLPKIYKQNLQYPFWLSPRGNGLDCHRTWEALYLNRIPIVWNSSLNILYKNLPILIINNHHELNEKFLYEKLSKIKFYNYEKLYFDYWRQLILNKSTYQRRRLCWRANNIIR